MWGGFSVRAPTLSRFFSLHFLIPFVIILISIIHIIFLHKSGRNNPTGVPLNLDKIPFHPYFRLKDLLGLLILILIFIYFSILIPYFLCDPENFTIANPLNTPPHIQPERYFLFAYAILRSIPNKLGGVIALIFSIFILISLPLTIKNSFKPIFFYPSIKLIF